MKGNKGETMKKQILLVLLGVLILTSCGIIKDLEEVFNAADVKMEPVGYRVDAQTPGSFDPYNNPACTVMANYSFNFDIDMEADNSANEGAAQIGTVELDLVPDTVGASAIPVTGAGTRLAGGEIDTLVYSGTLNGADTTQRVGFRYLASRIATNSQITMNTSGSYTVEVGQNDVTLPAPEKQLNYTPSVNATARSIIAAALAFGVFD